MHKLVDLYGPIARPEQSEILKLYTVKALKATRNILQEYELHL